MCAQVQQASLRKYASLYLTWAVILILPWLLGGQLLTIQLFTLVVALFACAISPRLNHLPLRLPVALLICLCAYVLIQFGNPSYSQQWQLGLRVWNLVPADHFAWLPTSIDSGFTDASPLRFLIHIVTAAALGFVLLRSSGNKFLIRTLVLVVLGGAILALLGLIQVSTESKTILGLFKAKENGYPLFFSTFLYKNHAASFLNLTMAMSCALFFQTTETASGRRSNPSLLFLICAIVIFIGVVASRSRFGFVCGLFILSTFFVIGAYHLRKRNLGKLWLITSGAIFAVLAIFGTTFLLKSTTAQHLQTLNSQITDDSSFKQRSYAYASGWDMFTAKPIYGWGAGNFRHGFRAFQNLEAEQANVRNTYMEKHELNFFWQHMHNDYLEWLIELGVVGFLILISFPGYFFWRIYKSGRWKEPVPLLLLAGLGSTMIHALVDFPFQNPAILVTWFTLLAITTSLCESDEPTRGGRKRTHSH